MPGHELSGLMKLVWKKNKPIFLQHNCDGTGTAKMYCLNTATNKLSSCEQFACACNYPCRIWYELCLSSKYKLHTKSVINKFMLVDTKIATKIMLLVKY